MTYEQALQYVNSLSKFGIEPGLSRIKKLLDILGNPQNDLKFIHVAGTNGKGSTCAYISSILSCSGFKTGLFISPFIIDFRERMQINKQMIPKKDLIELINYIMPLVNNMADNGEFITEFELITAIAFLWFKKEKCDIVVLEVGLGGRLDATNVINNALVSVITSISFDHINILGSTIKEIAGEKAGILKPRGTLVLYPHQSPETFDVIKFDGICKNPISSSKLLLVIFLIRIGSSCSLATYVSQDSVPNVLSGQSLLFSAELCLKCRI